VKIAVTVVAADLGGMIPPLLSRRVAPQADGVGDAELPAEMGDNARRDLGQVGQEGPQEPHGPELHGKPQAVVITSVPGDELTIRIVEMEVAAPLCRRWLARIAAVAALLLRGQEVDGHPGPFLKSPLHLDGECQIGSYARGVRGYGKIIGFPEPISCDKMAIPYSAETRPATPSA
jgi:hypothetical protein